MAVIIKLWFKGDGYRVATFQALPLYAVWLAFCSDNMEATLNFYYITEGTYLPFLVPFTPWFTLAIVLKFLYDNRTSENLQREELRIMQYNEYSA
jgi:hypothetical protein